LILQHFKRNGWWAKLVTIVAFGTVHRGHP
jgi:hypothetical protein